MIVTFRSSTGAIPITSWENVVYGGGRFFAQCLGASFDGFSFANSPTGDFWNGIIPPANFWNDLAYGEGKCALIGSRNDLVGTTYDGAYTEDFGDTWDTFQIEPTQRLWENIAFGAGKWIAMTNGGTVATSNDSLLTWQTASLPEDCEWEDVVYGDGLWVAVSPDATQGKVMTSTDGLNWTQGPTPDETQSWKSVTYGNGRFVAVACDFADATSSTMWSDDGINWNIVSPVVNSLWVNVAYGKGQFVAVSINDIAMSSSDFGLTWDLADTPTGTFRWRSVAYGEDVFVAVADYAGSSGQGNRSMLAAGTGNDPTPPPRPPGETITPKERIEALFAQYPDGNGYIRVARDGTDYVVAIVGSYQNRGTYKIKRYDVNGILIVKGFLPGTEDKWKTPSEISEYSVFFTNPFPPEGIDDTPAIDLPPGTPGGGGEEVNLDNITGSYNTLDGYGEMSVKNAIEYVTGDTLPDQAPVQDDFGQNMYGLDRIGAPEAWAAGYTGEGIIIAVIDTGIDTNHPELDDNLWVNVDEIPNNGIDDDGNGYIDDVHGFNFRDGNSNVQDTGYHGTHVAGTIAGEVGGQVQGVAYNAKLMTLSVFGQDGASVGDIVEAIYYAVDNGANIINMSLGIRQPEETVDPAVWTNLRVAMRYANDNGVITVAAAGNDQFSSPAVPGSYAVEAGIVVGAVKRGGDFDDSYSNKAGGAKDYEGDGAELPLYVSAAGTQIWSTFPQDGFLNLPGESPDGYNSISGTSMASPHVAAAIALMLEADPTLTPDQIRVVLANTTQ